jgi:cell division protein ZapA
MGQVSLSVNGRKYEVRCDDGQEGHLHELADYVNSRVSELIGGAGQIGEARVLLMASLLIADELMEAKADLRELRDGREAEPGAEPGGPESLDEAVGLHLELLANRLENIAERLKPS